MQVCKDKEQTGENEGRENGEESGVPELVWVEAYPDGSAKAEEERSHKTHSG